MSYPFRARSLGGASVLASRLSEIKNQRCQANQGPSGISVAQRASPFLDDEPQDPATETAAELEAAINELKEIIELVEKEEGVEKRIQR